MSGILPDVEGGIFAARIECPNFPSAQVLLTAFALIRISVRWAGKPDFYGRQDACRYATVRRSTATSVPKQLR